MTGKDEITSIKAIAICRDLNRKLAVECNAKGICPEDVAIAALHSAFDIAESAIGPGAVAVEWLRTGLDVIEQGILSGDRAP